MVGEYGERVSKVPPSSFPLFALLNVVQHIERYAILGTRLRNGILLAPDREQAEPQKTFKPQGFC
jgi:hypothetical protein